MFGFVLYIFPSIFSFVNISIELDIVITAINIFILIIGPLSYLVYNYFHEYTINWHNNMPLFTPYTFLKYLFLLMTLCSLILAIIRLINGNDTIVVIIFNTSAVIALICELTCMKTKMETRDRQDIELIVQTDTDYTIPPMNILEFKRSLIK